VRIVGILPPGYRPPNNGVTVQPDVFLPSSFENQRMERLRRSMVIVGRLRGGASLAEARGEIAAITAQAAREYPEGTTPPASLVNAIRDDVIVFALDLFLQELDTVLLGLMIGAGLCLKRRGPVLKEFLLPAVEHRRLQPQLVTELGHRLLLQQMSPQNGDFLFSRVMLPCLLHEFSPLS